MAFMIFFYLDIQLGQAPDELPYDIAFLVGSDVFSTVNNNSCLAIVLQKSLYDAHQPSIFNEVVAMTPIFDSCKKFSPPQELIINKPIPQPILALKNSKLLCAFYELDQMIGQSPSEALLEIIPIIYWHFLPL